MKLKIVWAREASELATRVEILDAEMREWHHHSASLSSDRFGNLVIAIIYKRDGSG